MITLHPFHLNQQNLAPAKTLAGLISGLGIMQWSVWVAGGTQSGQFRGQPGFGEYCAVAAFSIPTTLNTKRSRLRKSGAINTAWKGQAAAK